MKKQIEIILTLLATIFLFSCTNSLTAQKEKNTFQPVQTETPARPAGQKDVLGLVALGLDTFRVGFIGLGSQGPATVMRFTHIPGTKLDKVGGVGIFTDGLILIGAVCPWVPPRQLCGQINQIILKNEKS